jgi:hypothetical protein
MNGRVNRCRLLKQIGWEDFYGTTFSGQIPDRRTDENLCNINFDLLTFPGLTSADFHYFHRKCPYSANEDAFNYILDYDQSSPTYGQYVAVPTAQLVPHTATSGIAIRWNRGNKYGWLCVDDACSYYTTIASGERFFIY